MTCYELGQLMALPSFFSFTKHSVGVIANFAKPVVRLLVFNSVVHQIFVIVAHPNISGERRLWKKWLDMGAHLSMFLM